MPSRVHGGAISFYRTYYNMSLIQRSLANAEDKKAIAGFIPELIQDGDTLMMNADTTTLFAFRMLSVRKDLKIVTNSVSIALEATGNPNFRMLLLGGNINS